MLNFNCLHQINMKRIIFLALVSVVLLLFIKIDVLACGCIQVQQTPKQRIEGKLKYNRAVFSGKILEIIRKPHSRDAFIPDVFIKIKVDRFWKGNLSREIFITSELYTGGSCGAYFEIGKRYLIFARGKDENSLITSACDFNTEIEKATEELKILGKSNNPRKP